MKSIQNRYKTCVPLFQKSAEFGGFHPSVSSPTKPFCLLFGWTNSDQTCASRGSPDPTAVTHGRTALCLHVVGSALGRKLGVSCTVSRDLYIYLGSDSYLPYVL